MIFRRRRTRIEIEHTTVRLETGFACPEAITPTAPSPADPFLARVPPFQSPESTGLNPTPSPIPTAISPAKETRS